MTGERHASEAGLRPNAATCVQRGDEIRRMMIIMMRTRMMELNVL